MLGISRFFWLHETAACCYFGVDLEKKLDHYSLSRLADGTPYSSSDLLYFTLLLPFYLSKLFQVQILFSLLLFGQSFSKSSSSSLSSSDKNILSPVFFRLKKIPSFLLIHFILLPLESKHCPLTLASVLVCANSADELQF